MSTKLTRAEGNNEQSTRALTSRWPLFRSRLQPNRRRLSDRPGLRLSALAGTSNRSRLRSGIVYTNVRLAREQREPEAETSNGVCIRGGMKKNDTATERRAL